MSPAAYEVGGTGIGGVSATATSPKMPTAFTVAVEPFGTVYLSSMLQQDVEISVATQRHVADVADAHAGEQHGLPLLEVLAPREARVQRISRLQTAAHEPQRPENEDDDRDRDEYSDA